MRDWPDIGLLLAHRLLSWPNREPTLAQRLMFAGIPPWRAPIMIASMSHNQMYFSSFPFTFSLSPLYPRVCALCMFRQNLTLWAPENKIRP